MAIGLINAMNSLSGNVDQKYRTKPFGSIIKTVVECKSSDTFVSNSVTETSILSFVFSTDGAVGSVGQNKTTIFGFLYLWCYGVNDSSTGKDSRKQFTCSITGDDITNISFGPSQAIGNYNYGTGGIKTGYLSTILIPECTLDGSGHASISMDFKIRNENANANEAFEVFGDGTTKESHCRIFEVLQY